jgi:uncharacterized membrane protein (DUF4010 family)
MAHPALDPDVLDRFQRLGVALAIGLLIGLERGWREREGAAGSRTAGLRTHALIGLLAAAVSMLAQELGGIVLALAFLAFAGVMGAFEIDHARRLGVSDATPFVATLVTFALGALAGVGHVEAAAAAGVTAAIILAFKESLHVWLQRVTFKELQAGLVLAAMTAIILPLLPAEPIDPWGALSLRTVWLLTVLIAVVSFMGYAAIRILGPERGPLAAGLAGGLVSSTAVVASFSRMANTPGADAGALVAGAVLANMMMFLRVGVIASVLRPNLAPPLAGALIPAAIASAGMALWLARRARAREVASGAGAVMALPNPLALRVALVFGGLLAIVSLAAAALQDWVGPHGVYAVAAASGIADADAVTLAMTQSGRTNSEVAALAVLIAVAVNTAAKAAIARIAGGPRVGDTLAITSAIALIVGLLGLLAEMAL